MVLPAASVPWGCHSEGPLTGVGECDLPDSLRKQVRRNQEGVRVNA